MHAYSVEFIERKSVPFYLAGVAGGVVFFLKWVVGLFGPDLGVELSVPSSFAAYGLLYLIFDQWLWKVGILRTFGVVKTPYVGGTWVGKLKSSHSGMAKEHDITVAIHQTWSTIRIALESTRSISWSEMTTIRSETPTDFKLRWEYVAEAKYPDETGKFNHRGVTYLRFSIEAGAVKPEMTGDYYTQSTRDTHGTIFLKRS